jgi:hypothetical protein
VATHDDLAEVIDLIHQKLKIEYTE